MKKLLISFIQCSSGTTAIEYALLGSIIAVGIVGSVTAIADATNENWNTVSSSFH